jgi:hypothetical protein
MPSNVIDRDIVQADIAAKLATKFGATWDVFDYETVTFAGKAKNIVIAASGSDRPIIAADSDESENIFLFDVYIFVLYQKTDEGWTAQNSKTALNTAEKIFSDWLNDNQVGTYWNRIWRNGASDARLIVDEAGQTLRREIIPIRTEKYS